MTFRRKLFYFFPVLMCFLLPFGSRFLSPVIVFWTLTSFLNFDISVYRNAFRQPAFLLCWGFFFLTLSSAFFSEDGAEALQAVEVKLSFLLFPHLLFAYRWPADLLKRCVVSFVSGCFFACLLLIARATFYGFQGNTDYFFYTLFSNFIHASYFAMYLNLAIALVIVLYYRWFRDERQILISSWFFVAVFAASIFLCSSKMGLLTFLLLIPILLAYRLRQQGRTKLLLAGLAFAATIVMMAILFPSALGRLTSLYEFDSSRLDKTSAESTSVRVFIWQQAARLATSNFWSGTGVGDANNELYKAYEVAGMEGALSHRLNAHNQFLQTFIGLGIAGLAVLLVITLVQLIIAIVKRHFLLFVFSLLVCLNFLVESMLQTAAGVIFFSFFFCFFSITSEKELLHEEGM